MEMILITPDSQEWIYMWNWLAEHPINQGTDDTRLALNQGEAWQYMGSIKQGDKVIHQFRHRCHPKTQQTLKLSVNGSNEITDDDITKKYKV